MCAVVHFRWMTMISADSGQRQVFKSCFVLLLTQEAVGNRFALQWQEKIRNLTVEAFLLASGKEKHEVLRNKKHGITSTRRSELPRQSSDRNLGYVMYLKLISFLTLRKLLLVSYCNNKVNDRFKETEY